MYILQLTNKLASKKLDIGLQAVVQIVCPLVLHGEVKQDFLHLPFFWPSFGLCCQEVLSYFFKELYGLLLNMIACTCTPGYWTTTATQQPFSALAPIWASDCLANYTGQVAGVAGGKCKESWAGNTRKRASWTTEQQDAGRDAPVSHSHQHSEARQDTSDGLSALAPSWGCCLGFAALLSKPGASSSGLLVADHSVNPEAALGSNIHQVVRLVFAC